MDGWFLSYAGDLENEKEFEFRIHWCSVACATAGEGALTRHPELA